MRIELENLFRSNLNSGINLFIGAGFSIEAQNKHGENLLLGEQLAQQLSKKFGAPKLDLPKVASIIESRDKEGLFDFLVEKFTVKTFDVKYNNLAEVAIKNIFTTNIDDLIFKIFQNRKEVYINDTTLQGPSFQDRKAIDYFPLHGCILNKEKPLVFTPLAIASSFSNNSRLWEDLVKSIERCPTVFWGYGLNDTGVLESLNAVNVNGVARAEKWIVMHEENFDEEEYFKSLGFNIILATNQQLLDFIGNTLTRTYPDPISKRGASTFDLLGENFIPTNPANIAVRQIEDFYLGAAPSWSDIFRPDLYKTSHFRTIQNSIYSHKNTIVIGIPGSGKSTLMMQIAAFTEFKGHKILLEHPSFQRAENILKCLGNESAIIFIDNFTDDFNSFDLFNNRPNIKLVGFDREHNFEVISHLLDRDDYTIISVTTLSSSDIQEIYSRIPQRIKSKILKRKASEADELPSLFEFLNLNLSLPSINERYNKLMESLEENDPILLEFLLLTSYVHYARTPLSFDMVYSFFSSEITSYKDVYEVRDRLGELLVDNPISLIEDDNQDYFSTRSTILSEVIIKQVDSNVLKRVLNKFIEHLPPYKIVKYSTFKKRGYDKYIAVRAFRDWEEGKEYFERLIREDPKNPFLLQQGALYLSYKQRHTEAFYWIEKAKNMTNDSLLSIRNSHAIILFEANIKKEGQDVRSSLDLSMDILNKCYLEDKRKLYHAKKFAEQAIDYFKRFGDDKSIEYLNLARNWVNDELKVNGWNKGLKQVLFDINRLVFLK